MICLSCGGELKKPWQKKFCSRACFGRFPKSDETRLKIGQAGMSRIQSQETKDKRAAKHRGMKRPPETGQRISAAKLGKRLSDETRQKMSFTRKNNPLVRGEFHYAWKSDREEARQRAVVSKVCYYLIGRYFQFVDANRDDVIEELGYRPSELKTRLEKLFKPGMKWGNHGIKGWHVDHVRPIATFPIGTPWREMNALSNLQPLWAVENLSKGKRYVS